jgi:aldose 1-epimerase
MKISKEYFGKTGKEKGVYLFSLNNDKGTEVKITNYGACVTSIVTTDKNGKADDIVLGFDSLEQYEAGHPYFGVICGRYANRISNAAFTIDNATYKLAANDGRNTLHGGLLGFDKVIWMAGTIENKEEVGVKLVYLSPNMEEGFPGNMVIEVSYLLNNNNELIILYSAKTDKTTVINVTNHSYFNLNGCKKEIYDHVLIINSDKLTEVNSEAIPTGKLMNLSGTGFDFKKPGRIGATIDSIPGGYDHNYVINKKNTGEYVLAAKLADPESGRVLETYTTEPGVQFYSGNFLDGTKKGKNGIVYKKHFGMCLETQHYPDSPNQKDFPSTLLKPGETYTQKTVYKFGVEK